VEWLDLGLLPLREVQQGSTPRRRFALAV